MFGFVVYFCCMNANELRIGNWTFHSGLPKKINECGIMLCTRFPKRFAPIPLTEEWLLQFGYKCFNGRSLYSNGSDFHIDFNNGTGQLRDSISDDYNHVGITVKFAHQLQNLYFALTGTELELSTSHKPDSLLPQNQS